MYRHWRGRFYPPDLPQHEWFAYYSHHFDTVELNNSFYRMPSERAWRRWAEHAPASFRFSVKASRFITHIRRLQDCEQPVQLLVRRAALLGEHCGPLLYQLPPNLPRDDARLVAFLAILPRTVRHVIEFRHPSWFAEAVYRQLREANVGFCIFHRPDLETPRAVTTDFAYIRFHGADRLYGGCYSDRQLLEWARWLLHLHSEVKDVFIYFNNDAQAYAVQNALTLRHLLNP